MAQTYTLSDAWILAAPQISRKLEDGLSSYIVNLAINRIWMRYDWKVSIATLPPFYLTSLVQDYGSPIYSVPTDFLGLRQAKRENVGTVPPASANLAIIPNLQLTHEQRLPEAICYDKATSNFRVFPRVPAGVSSTQWIVTGEYKTLPTKITAQTFGTTTLPWDDTELHVVVEAIKLTAFELASDPRVQQQTVIYERAVDEMASNEGLNSGYPIISPAESLLGVSTLGGSGWYGV